MTFENLIATLQDQDMMLPLLGSLIAGVLIGGEREFQGKPAGLRTHCLVCFAATLMTLLGLRMDEWYVALPEGTQIVSDMSRMPHAIITGIGFLGAGVIFREGASVQGLTTAASLWLTAAIGVVFGTGLMELATIATVIALMVLILLRMVQRISPVPAAVRLEIVAGLSGSFDQSALRRVLADLGLDMGQVSLTQDIENGESTFALLATKRGGAIDTSALALTLASEPELRKVSISPLENDALLNGA